MTARTYHRSDPLPEAPDPAFVRSVKETARRRDELSGLSPEGTREAHEAFAATVDPW